MQKGFSHIYLIVGVVAIILAGYGLLSLNNKTSTQLSISQTTITTSPSPKDQVTTLKTFKNESIGIEFQYPSTWKEVNKNPFKITTTRESLGFGTGDIEVLTTNNSEKYELNINRGGKEDSREEITLDGKKATKLVVHVPETLALYNVSVVTTHNGKTYIISLSTQDKTLEKTLTQEFDQILSTFKFTN